MLFNLKLYAETGLVTGLKIPRFVSLKSNDVNLRVGPSINYPIDIKYIQKNLPIEIIDEFDVWRKIKDHEKNIGWLHKSLIKGDRFVLTAVIFVLSIFILSSSSNPCVKLGIQSIHCVLRSRSKFIIKNNICMVDIGGVTKYLCTLNYIV